MFSVEHVVGTKSLPEFKTITRTVSVARLPWVRAGVAIRGCRFLLCPEFAALIPTTDGSSLEPGGGSCATAAFPHYK